MTNTLTVKFLRSFTQNKLFSAEYIKADGTKSKGTFRFGVRKGVKGSSGRGASYNAEERNHARVFNMHKNGFRVLMMDNLISIKFKGKVYSRAELEFIFMVERMYQNPRFTESTTQVGIAA